MRIITIGSSPSSNICINSKHVSAVHADLLLMDNGDIILTDKGSMNGTYLFGNRLEPYVDVPVTRGDKIEFAGCPLNWGSVPTVEIPDPSRVKGIYGVGKKPENRYCLSGNSVSRYHATIKEMKNGKWFIQDHSTNGTFINGQRIPSNQDIQLKRGDKIVCGNVPMQNPVTGTSIPWKGLSIVGIAAACVAALILLIPAKRTDQDRATVMLASITDVYGFSIGDTKFYWYRPTYSEKTVLTFDEDKAMSLRRKYSGTGFFISDDGLIVTNRHLTSTWDLNFLKSQHYITEGEVYDLISEVGDIACEDSDVSTTLLSAANRLASGEINDYELAKIIYEKGNFIVDNTVLGVQYPNRTYSEFSYVDVAYVEMESSEADVSLIRLESHKTPEFAEYFNINRSVANIKKISESDNYVSVGYPAGFMLATSDNKLTSTRSFRHLSQKPSYKRLTFQGDATIGGESGSSICDPKGRLVGVLSSGDTQHKDQTYAVPIHYVLELCDQLNKQNGN